MDRWEDELPDKQLAMDWISVLNRGLQAALAALAWIDPYGIVGFIQMFMLEFVNRILGLNTEPWSPEIVLNLIMAIASKSNRFDILIKWRL